MRNSLVLIEITTMGTSYEEKNTSDEVLKVGIARLKCLRERMVGHA